MFPINFRPRPANLFDPMARTSMETAQTRAHFESVIDNQRGSHQRGGQNPLDPAEDNSERP